jgi:hypothetical protein
MTSGICKISSGSDILIGSRISGVPYRRANSKHAISRDDFAGPIPLILRSVT